MSVFWLPEATPPQLSDESVTTIETRILEDGIAEACKPGLQRLENSTAGFATYLDQLGFNLNDLSDEGLWPARVLKIGASLTWAAYREAGYSQPIDDESLAISHAIAGLEGVPDAYFSSLWQDQRLLSLIETVSEAQLFNTYSYGGYRQMLDMGAGCVRFYMQGALAA